MEKVDEKDKILKIKDINLMKIVDKLKQKQNKLKEKMQVKDYEDFENGNFDFRRIYKDIDNQTEHLLSSVMDQSHKI